MKYDFTGILERKGDDAIALDGAADFCEEGILPGFDIIPMWVADMNFPTCPSILEAIAGRAAKPHFGYFTPKEEYYNGIIRWQETRNGVKGLTQECIGYENSVLGGVATALATLCSKGDKVLVHSPVYIGFTGVLENNGYHAVHTPLKKDENGVWRMDFADIEQKFAEEKIHTAIFCSPQNPCGRVWEGWEIERFMELCKKYDVYVISDEIWSDIIRPGKQHIPTQSVSEDARMRTIALYAPSKTFSLAGLIGSYHIIYSPRLRDRVRKEASLGHYNCMNLLSMYAQIGSTAPEGYEWADEMNAVVAENIDYACTYIQEHFRGVEVSKPQGTYMLFLDCSGWEAANGVSHHDLLQKGFRHGVIWQDGERFFGPCCIRLNLALPLSRVKEAFARMDQYIFNA